jgi:hypothetical protein
MTIHRSRGHNVPEAPGTQFPEDRREELRLEVQRLFLERSADKCGTDGRCFWKSPCTCRAWAIERAKQS